MLSISPQVRSVSCTRECTQAMSELWVESEVGHSSIFHFAACFERHHQTPLVDAREPPTRTRPHTRYNRIQTLNILLAYDTLVNQITVVRSPKKMGHSAIVAEYCHKALAAQTYHPIDLVLMDVQMPEMDGLEATAAIRAQEQTTGDHLQLIA
jgi:PleD family two-component response regulator